MILNCKYKGNSDFQNGKEYQLIISFDGNQVAEVVVDGHVMTYTIPYLLSEWAIVEEAISKDVWDWMMSRELYIQSLESWLYSRGKEDDDRWEDW